jgi:uncharacterized protein
MHINLYTKIKPNATIICGFPGYGLIGTITTEFLIEHLNAVEIGVFHYEEVPPTLAIHQGKVIKPMTVFYNKKHNIVIIHVMISTKGIEWKIADAIAKLNDEIKAKEIINLEGVAGAPKKKQPEFFYIGNHKLADLGLKLLKESIVLGVIAGLILRAKNITAIFATTTSKLPDSKSSAKVIEILDKYLDLDIDYKPLLKQAEIFEIKLKKIIERSNSALQTVKNKDMDYVG